MTRTDSNGDQFENDVFDLCPQGTHACESSDSWHKINVLVFIEKIQSLCYFISKNVKKLGEICEIVSGATPNTKKGEYYGEEILWATPKDLSGLKDIIINNTNKLFVIKYLFLLPYLFKQVLKILK